MDDLGRDTKPQRSVRVNVGLTSAADIVSTGLDRAHHPLGLYNSTGDETLKRILHDLRTHADPHRFVAHQRKAIDYEAHLCADERSVAEKIELGSSKPGNRLKLGLWNVRSCQNECKMDEIETQL